MSKSKVFNFEKLKTGNHNGRDWMLSKYRGQRFLFTSEVISVLELNTNAETHSISEESIVVESEKDALYIKMRVPLKTMKGFMSFKHLLHKGMTYADLQEYLSLSLIHI